MSDPKNQHNPDAASEDELSPAAGEDREGIVAENVHGVRGSEGAVAPYDLEPDSKPRAAKRGLIEDFEEDADFDHDPEVERALRGGRNGERKGSKETKEDGALKVHTLAREAWDPPRVIAVLGAVVTIPALVASWLQAAREPNADAMDALIATLLTLYNTGLHTITGVAAVILSAVLLNLAPGRIELISARMLLAVAVFQGLSHIQLGYGLPVLLGVLGYLTVLAVLMRTTRDRLFVMSATHLVLVGITQLGMMLYAAADARATAG